MEIYFFGVWKGGGDLEIFWFDGSVSISEYKDGWNGNN